MDLCEEDDEGTQGNAAHQQAGLPMEQIGGSIVAVAVLAAIAVAVIYLIFRRKKQKKKEEEENLEEDEDEETTEEDMERMAPSMAPMGAAYVPPRQPPGARGFHEGQFRYGLGLIGVLLFGFAFDLRLV